MNVLGNRLHQLRNHTVWVGIGAMILGPLWGFLAMGFCRLLHGGPVADTLSFYLMVAGWMVMPIGILMLLYRLAVRTIISQRKDAGGPLDTST